MSRQVRAGCQNAACDRLADGRVPLPPEGERSVALCQECAWDNLQLRIPRGVAYIRLSLAPSGKETV